MKSGDEIRVDELLAETAGRAIVHHVPTVIAAVENGKLNWETALGLIVELGREAERVLLAGGWDFLAEQAEL